MHGRRLADGFPHCTSDLIMCIAYGKCSYINKLSYHERFGLNLEKPPIKICFSFCLYSRRENVKVSLTRDISLIHRRQFNHLPQKNEINKINKKTI